MSDFERETPEFDWSSRGFEERAQVPTTDRMPPPPQKDSNDSKSDD